MFAYAVHGQRQGAAWTLMRCNEGEFSVIAEGQDNLSFTTESGEGVSVIAPWHRAPALNRNQFEQFAEAMAKHLTSLWKTYCKLKPVNKSPKSEDWASLLSPPKQPILLILPEQLPVSLIETCQKQLNRELDAHNIAAETNDIIGVGSAWLAIYLTQAWSSSPRLWQKIEKYVCCESSPSSPTEIPKQHTVVCIYDDEISSKKQGIAVAWQVQITDNHIDIELLSRRYWSYPNKQNAQNCIAQWKTMLPTTKMPWVLLGESSPQHIDLLKTAIQQTSTPPHFFMISSTKQAAQTRATGALLWYHLFGNGIDQTINLRWHPRFAILPLPYGPDTSPFNIQCSSLPHCFDTQTLLFQREITRTQQRLSIFPMGFRLLWNPASKGNAWIPIDDLLFDDVEHQEAQAGHTVCGITTQSAFQHTLLVHLLELRNTHKTSRISPQKSSEEGRRRTKRSSPQIPHNAVHIHRKTSYRLPPPWRYV